jgi:hypothetical protein
MMSDMPLETCWAFNKCWNNKFYYKVACCWLFLLSYTAMHGSMNINPLNAELNPICHLLVLLGDLTFMGPCIISIFQYICISNKMQRYTVYLYLETALHVSGGTSTHHQELIQLYLQHLVFVTPVWVCCGWRTPPTAHSKLFQLFHDSGR